MRLKKGNFPQIYWEQNWHYLCHLQFIDNNFGATHFCQKLNYKNGTIEKYVPEKGKIDVYNSDTFAMGACAAKDIWPQCSLGCNSLAVGGGCQFVKNDGDARVYVRCFKGKSKKFLIKCHDRNSTDEEASCVGELLFIICSYVSLKQNHIKYAALIRFCYKWHFCSQIQKSEQ